MAKATASVSVIARPLTAFGCLARLLPLVCVAACGSIDAVSDDGGAGGGAAGMSGSAGTGTAGGRGGVMGTGGTVNPDGSVQKDAGPTDATNPDVNEIACGAGICARNRIRTRGIPEQLRD